jgi:hypothetical protein
LSERLSCVETAGFNAKAKVQREEGKEEVKKGTQSREGAKVQREGGKREEGKEEVKKGTQGREGAKVQREDSRTVG